MIVTAFFVWVRSLVALFERPREEPLPFKLQVIEVMGHGRHVGSVRRVGGLFEVIEDPLGVPAHERVDRRFYGAHAIYQIRDLTPAEERAREEQRAFEARPCRHCGAVVCPWKGRAEEDVHVGTASGSDTWCERWGVNPARVVTLDEARQEPARVTCGECRTALADEQLRGKRRDEGEDEPPPDSDEDVSYAHAGSGRGHS